MEKYLTDFWKEFISFFSWISTCDENKLIAKFIIRDSGSRLSIFSTSIS